MLIWSCVLLSVGWKFISLQGWICLLPLVHLVWLGKGPNVTNRGKMKIADRQALRRSCLSSLPSHSRPELRSRAAASRPLRLWLPTCSVQSRHPQGEHPTFSLSWPVACAHPNPGSCCHSQLPSLRVSASDLLLTLYTCWIQLQSLPTASPWLSAQL